jgi:hypothetical protein
LSVTVERRYRFVECSIRLFTLRPTRLFAPAEPRLLPKDFNGILRSSTTIWTLLERAIHDLLSGTIDLNPRYPKQSYETIPVLQRGVNCV